MIAQIGQVLAITTTKHLAIGILGFIFLWQACLIIYSLFLSPLRKVPGPFLARFTRLWELHHVLQGDFHNKISQLHDLYGPVVRVSPNRYSFNHVKDMKVIYAPGSKFRKTMYYHPVNQGNPNIFATGDEQEHTVRRRGVASFYTMTSMVSYEPAVEKMVDVCMNQLRKFASEKHEVDMPKFMSFYAFDTVSEISANENFGMMDSQKDTNGLIAIGERINIYLSKCGLFPELHEALVLVGKLFGFTDPSITIGKTVRSIIKNQRILREQRGGLPANPDALTFTDKLLGLDEVGKATPMMFNDSWGANLAAGTDTTSTTLGAAIFYIYRNPSVLRKLREAIKEGEVSGTISSPITFAEAQNLKYFQAVIQEVLRIHPAVGQMLPRRVPKGGVMLAGQFFPEGSEVGVNAWAMHRNPELSGKDAAQFMPERWLDPNLTSDVKTGMSFSFGAGSRTCLGKNVSLLEMNKLLVEIVRHFDMDFSMNDGLTPDGPVPATSDFFVRPQYRCVVKERSAEVVTL